MGVSWPCLHSPQAAARDGASSLPPNQETNPTPSVFTTFLHFPLFLLLLACCFVDLPWWGWLLPSPPPRLAALIERGINRRSTDRRCPLLHQPAHPYPLPWSLPPHPAPPQYPTRPVAVRPSLPFPVHAQRPPFTCALIERIINTDPSFGCSCCRHSMSPCRAHPCSQHFVCHLPQHRAHA